VTLLQHIMRIAGAAIVFAVLALAPTAAKAHSGHSHAPSVQQISSAGAIQNGAKAVEPVQKSAPQVSAAASNTSKQPAGPNGCNGSCCKSAMACCVVIFSYSSETPVPCGNSVRLAFPEAESWSSLASDQLRRPPKIFA
jgi:hypothetical protein